MEILQTILAPLMMMIGGTITWIIKSKSEELKTIEKRLHSERREIYSKILVPYIHIFSDLKGNGLTIAMKKITSYEYKKTAFELNLIGSDGVVNAYNQLMQYSFKSEASGETDSLTMMKKWGQLLLEIRKNLGNKNTTLSEIDMLRGMIKDINNYL